MASAVGTAAVTVTSAVADVPSTVAVMVARPRSCAVTVPADTSATEAAEVDHSAVAVRSRLPPSLYRPVATSAPLLPLARLKVFGAMLRSVRTASVTVNSALTETEPEVAVTVALPGAIPTATPDSGSMLAIAVLSRVHATSTALSVPSL